MSSFKSTNSFQNSFNENPTASNATRTQRFYNFIFPLLYQSIDEQILDIENFCGLFPKDAYFVHRGKTVSIQLKSLFRNVVMFS